MRTKDEAERMTDFIDRGAHRAQLLVDDGIAHVRRAQEVEYKRLGPPTGFCLWCDAETMDPTARFCDLDCSADWQRDQDAQRRNRS